MVGSRGNDRDAILDGAVREQAPRGVVFEPRCEGSMGTQGWHSGTEVPA